MTEKDLMAGAFVYFNCFDGSKIVVCVTGFNDGIVYGDSENGSHWCNIGKVEPIPITPEILEKNGFTQCEPQGYGLYVKGKKGEGLYNILWQGESYNYYLEIAAYTYPFGEFNKTNIKYVHQLQHALLLCGIEKEMIL